MHLLNQLPIILLPLLSTLSGSTPVAFPAETPDLAAPEASNDTSLAARDVSRECSFGTWYLNMKIMDDDWPAKNQYKTASYPLPGQGSEGSLTYYADPGLPSSENVHIVEKLGGEVRVELDFHFEYGSPEVVYLVYDLKLFEGTSEDTDDLDGRKTGREEIRNPTPATKDFIWYVKSTEPFSADDVKVNISVAKYSCVRR